MEYRTAPYYQKSADMPRKPLYWLFTSLLYCMWEQQTTLSPGASLSTELREFGKSVVCAMQTKEKHQNQTNNRQILVLSASDPCGNRTHVNGVRGRCLNRLTNGPYKKRSRHLPIFTGRLQPTIFGTSELNFCVRNGNRWNLTVIDTDRLFFLRMYPQN